MYIKILKEISQVIGEYLQDGIVDCINSKGVQEVRRSYNELVEENRIEGFYQFLKKEYDDDVQLLCVIYSILYEVTKEDILLEKVCDLLIEYDIDEFLMQSIQKQVDILLLMKLHKSSFYKKRMKIHNIILNKLIRELKIEYHKLPVEERNKKLVLLVTDQLIGIKHAPTAIVYRVATVLQKYYGFRVIVMCMKTVISEEVCNYWVQLFHTNGSNEIGRYVFNPYGEEIEVFNVPMEKKNLAQIREVIDSLYHLKPLLSWYIGGESTVGDLIGQMTTSLAMLCNNGYGVHNADYMIAYKNDGSDEIKLQEQYILQHGQKLLNLKIVSDHRLNYTGKLHREDIGASREEFLIAIVGNRLEYEVGEEYILSLKKIVSFKERVRVVFCGDITDNLQGKINSILGDTQYYLGWRSDLVDVISLCDFMLNPPRVGGGGSAMMALAMGVPVLSLKQCDVSMSIGDESCCETMEEYLELAKLYVTDSKFLKEKSEAATAFYEGLGVDKFQYYLGEMLREVNKQENLGLQFSEE